MVGDLFLQPKLYLISYRAGVPTLKLETIPMQAKSRKMSLSEWLYLQYERDINKVAFSVLMALSSSVTIKFHAQKHINLY